MISFAPGRPWIRLLHLRVAGLAWSHAPESAAHGLLALAPLGAAMGPTAMAMALLGAVVANVVGALIGGGRIVCAPRPSFSLLTAGLVAVLVGYRGPNGALSLAAVMSLLALALMAAGALQALLGALRFGDMVKYTPHPVRAALMSAVGVLLMWNALPVALGASFGASLVDALTPDTPSALLVAATATGVAVVATRRKTSAPPVVLGLVSATALYAGLNALGLQAGTRLGLPSFGAPWFLQAQDMGWLWALVTERALWWPVMVFAMSVAILATLDTLLAMSVIDGRLRRSRDVNRELRVYGMGNVLSGLAGGMMNSPSTVRSLLVLDAAPCSERGPWIYTAAWLAMLVLAPQVLGWLPLSAIGGVMFLQGVQIIDPWLWRTPALLRRRPHAVAAEYDATQRRLLLENWAIGLTAVVIGIAFGLAVAVATGAAVAVLLFVRAHMRQVVRSQHTGVHRRSLKVRSAQAADELARRGDATVLLELQGDLFFGTADTLRTRLDGLPPTVKTVVLDLYLVGEIDATGARILLEVAQDWARQGRYLVAAEWAEEDPRRRIVDVVGRSAGLPLLGFAPDVDHALEAAEDRLLQNAAILSSPSATLDLAQTLLAQGFDAGELALLRAELRTRRFEAGELLFRHGDAADGFCLTVQGDVGIRLPGHQRRLVSFAPGAMVGEMAALSRGARSTDAVAESPLTVLWLSNEALERLRREQPVLTAKLFNNIALHLAGRLRGVTQDLSAWVTRRGQAPATASQAPVVRPPGLPGSVH